MRGALSDLLGYACRGRGRLPILALQAMTDGRAGFFADKFTSVDPAGRDVGGDPLAAPRDPRRRLLRALGLSAAWWQWILLIALGAAWLGLLGQALLPARALAPGDRVRRGRS